MTIINLRGTNGSGKSTIVRGVLKAVTGNRPIYGVLGARRAEAYCLTLPKVARPVYLLGSYHVDSGGCDQIQPYDLILDLIKKYADKGHVIFEGVLISSSYGRVGELLETWGQQSVMAFLDTPLEVCIERVKARRSGHGDEREFNPLNLTQKWYNIVKSRVKIEASGRVRVVTVSSDNGAETVLRLLREAGRG